MECTRCGACCVAPDIAALDKPLGVRCLHLTSENLCAVYDDRPEVCRSYEADELCQRIEAPALDERVALYLATFGLTEEAAQVKSSGAQSMRTARRLPVLR
jgi:Fe-S-cluster containining protein